MLQQEQKKINVYTLKHVKELYREVTGEELANYTLTRLVKRGFIAKVISPGTRTQGLYLQSDVDKWIDEIKQQKEIIHIVA